MSARRKKKDATPPQPLREFCIFTMSGHRPLGYLHATDAHVAGNLARQMHGNGACIFPPSHMSSAELWLAHDAQDKADALENLNVEAYGNG